MSEDGYMVPTDAGIDMEAFRKIVQTMKEHEVPPVVVKTKKEARRLTQQDFCGRKWKVGDAYYQLGSLHPNWIGILDGK